MAIIGWGEPKRIPRLGKIAIGVRDKRGIPRPVDYFVVPPEVQKVYGPKPKELDIMVPSEDLELFFPAHLKRYGGQYGLICKGNGQTATLPAEYAMKFGHEYGLIYQNGNFIQKDTGQIINIKKGGKEWLTIPCAYKNCKFYIQKKCAEVAILNVILPKVPGVLGVYSLDTGSYNSYANITSSLSILRGMFSRISYIPLKLKIRMEQMNPVVNGKRIKTTVPVLYIDMGDISLMELMERAKSRQSIIAGSLPAPEVTGEEIEIEPVIDEVEAEATEDDEPDIFYPEEYSVSHDTEKHVEETPTQNDSAIQKEEGMFKVLSIPQVKPTTTGVFAVVQTLCTEGPLKGQMCEVWAGQDTMQAFAHIKPQQLFKATIKQIKEKEGKVLIKSIELVKESA